MIDLHTHSTVSDGSMTPTEVIMHAKKCGLSAVALTDHDEISGVAEAIAEGEKLGIEVIPGIELSVKSDTETHILGYFVDYNSPKLLHAINEARKVREERTMEVCRNLAAIGINVNYEEVVAAADGGMTSRGHIAYVMTSKGYTSSIKEAFGKYLAYGCPGYSSKQYLTAAEAVELINSAGGRAYVAHLHLICLDDDDLKSFLSELKEAGLAGIEGYYTDYTPAMQEKYQKMAQELGLSISGGTDFHADIKPHISIGVGYGNLRIPYSVLEAMKAEADKSIRNLSLT